MSAEPETLTLRDQFALRLVEAILPVAVDSAPDEMPTTDLHEAVVTAAYDLSDRMLRVREGGTVR